MIDSTVATAFPPHPRHTLHEPLEDRLGVRCDVSGEPARQRIDDLADYLSTPSLTITRDDLTAVLGSVTA